MKIFKLMKLYIMLINILVVVEDGKKYKGKKRKKCTMDLF